jgi:hypothetical protein
MTKESKIHMIPQIIIDCAENLLTSTNPNMKDTYTLRLEAIRDYCNEALMAAQHKTNYIPPKKNNILRSTKSQLNYSRVGRNNV